jgi:GNAT superfamily N-acetyltransferase
MENLVIKHIASPGELTDDLKKKILSLDKVLFETSSAPDTNYSNWWGAFYDGHLVGYASSIYYPYLNSCYLSRVGVMAGYRGYGLQKRFIRAREKRAKKDGYYRMVTYTSYDNIVSANNLIACGYKLYVPRLLYGVRNALYFQKTLK